MVPCRNYKVEVVCILSLYVLYLGVVSDGQSQRMSLIFFYINQPVQLFPFPVIMAMVTWALNYVTYLKKIVGSGLSLD